VTCTACAPAWLYAHRGVDRQHRAAEEGFVHNSSSAAKRRRAQLFAAWLVQQFGKERLNAGAGVLDVAGACALGMGLRANCSWG